MPWLNTTHDWAASVDADHLADIRRRSQELAPGGALHLVLEVIAYADEEAAARGSGRCWVTLHVDGSISVADDGRGTDTRLDEHGQPVKKPVMSTQDLRFFAALDPPLLPDGQPRRGMSLVAALSEWLLHVNRRHNGAWTQRYERGVPVTDLLRTRTDGTTGTTVRFLPESTVWPAPATLAHSELELLTRWRSLTVDVIDERSMSPDDSGR
jgi:DNA gyrase subunit B